MPEILIWRSCFCVLYLFQVLKQVWGAWSPPWSSCLLLDHHCTCSSLDNFIQNLLLPFPWWTDGYCISTEVGDRLSLASLAPTSPKIVLLDPGPWVFCAETASATVVGDELWSHEYRAKGKGESARSVLTRLWCYSFGSHHCCFCHLESALLASSKRCNTFVNKGIDALQRSMQFVTHWGPHFCRYIS